jgi:HNH endonuclease
MNMEGSIMAEKKARKRKLPQNDTSNTASNVRPAIPKQLERDVLVEAGHRCAIPTCKQTPVQIAHIIPWETVQEHTFDNLIALCPNCHERYDKKHEIDRKAIVQYKANLSVINQRYGDLEKRVLEHFAEHPNEDYIWLPSSLEILLMYLLKDGLLVDAIGKGFSIHISMRDTFASKRYNLTPEGKEFIQKWINAKEIE